MLKRVRRIAVAGAYVAFSAALLAPGAFASATPTLSLDQSAGNTAGSTTNLGMDLTFADSTGDSPDQMTINLPPGLLANADIDGGACLTTTDLTDTDCQVGTGTVSVDALDVVPLNNIAVTFDLVPPPAAGDLAGLAVNDGGTQLGSTAAIKIRPSGDPDGVGVAIDFVLPNSLDEDNVTVPIMITQIDSTFDGLRYPTSCPSTPANVSVSVNSYDDSTMQTVTAPLSVTGCSALPYAPKLSVTAAKGSTDRDVQLTTVVTQAADEAPSGSLSLTFAGSTLAVNLGAIADLCLNASSGTCTPVGTVTAVSPLYPTPLSAHAYLTGTVAGPTLTLLFPAPFPLTLIGKVDLDTLSTTFTGMPDIPLTKLSLVLNGGPSSLFATNCRPASGVVTGSSTDQNGDKTVAGSATYTISGCPAVAKATPATGVGSNQPTVTQATVTALPNGHPSLSFKIGVGKRAAKLTAVTVELPHGLSLVRHRVGKGYTVAGISVRGAKIKSIAISQGHLVITLRKPVTSLSVKITTALAVSPSLATEARAGKLKSLRLTVIAANTRGKRYTLHPVIRHPSL
jgi:hypothetical protein